MFESNEMAIFVYLSTTTKMTVYPLDLGKASIKSIVMCCQGISGTGKGFNSPGDLQFSCLAF